MTIPNAAIEGEGDRAEPPSKRIKLSPTAQPPPPQQPSSSNNNISTQKKPADAIKMDDEKPTMAIGGGNGFQPERETAVGILHFVNSSNPGFSGILKQRYTDFLVNEITPDGTVVHLTDDKPPKFKPVTQVKNDDQVQASQPVSEANENQRLKAEIGDQAQATKPDFDTKEDQCSKVEIEEQALAQVPRFAARDILLNPNFTGSNASEASAKAPAHISRFATRDVRLEDPGFTGFNKSEPPAKPPAHVSRFAAQDIRLEDPNFSFAKPTTLVNSTVNNPSSSNIDHNDDTSAKKTVDDAVRANLVPSSISPKSPGALIIKNEDPGDYLKDKTEIKDSIQSTDTTPSAVAPPVPTERPASDAEKPKSTFTITAEDDALLTTYFGANIKDQIIKFHAEVFAKPEKKPSLFGSLMSDPITDRELRTKLHQDVRRIFESRIETEVVHDGIIKISAAAKARPRQEFNPRPGRANQPKGKVGWQELGGQYLHFSLYKENKDTMEVISYLCRALKIKPRDFAFSGTKDRRAVTVQRVSVYRQYADRLAQNNRNLYNARIGNFKYEKHSLELGDLQGNEFLISLRDCHFGDDALLNIANRIELGTKVVGEAVKHLQELGFLNYFGLQRFGTFGIGTDEVGKMILKGDFEGAVRAILSVSSEAAAVAQTPGASSANKLVSRDDVARAKAIHLFNTGTKSHTVLDILPRKFSAESSIIRHLGLHDKKTDYLGALLTINRNLRLMYVHAYQSLVWNVAVSERWARYGGKVIKGDLVLVDGQAARNAAAHGMEDEVDENGEIVVRPAADDVAVSHDDLYQRARALTAEEAQSGQYSIFDIVLPTPGYDIEYPDNDIGDFYKEFMGSERGGGLDPADMRRSAKDFSLSGSYRKMLAQVGKDLSFEIKTYHEENEQLVETDLEKLNKSRPQHQQNSYQNDRRDDRQFDRRQDNGGRNNQYGRGGRQNGRNNRGGRRNDAAFGQRPAPTRDFNTPQHLAWNALPAKLAAEDKAAVEAAAAERLNPKKTEDVIPTYKDTYIQTTDKNGFSERTGYRSTVIHQGTAPVSTLSGSNAEPKPVPAPLPQQYDGVSEFEKPGTMLPPQYDGPSESNEVVDESSVSALPSDGDGAVVDAAKGRKTISSVSDSTDGGAKLDTSFEKPSNKRSAEKISSAPYIGTGVSDLSVSGEEKSNDDAIGVTQPAKGTEDVDVKMEMGETEASQPAKIAVIVKFALGSSQYATMALRELMKAGGVKTYKPDFSEGR